MNRESIVGFNESRSVNFYELKTFTGVDEMKRKCTKKTFTDEMNREAKLHTKTENESRSVKTFTGVDESRSETAQVK